jgi:hypothetical protein
MFGLRNEQRRDVFQRATALERFHQKLRQMFKPMAAARSGSAAAVTGTIALNLLMP